MSEHERDAASFDDPEDDEVLAEDELLAEDEDLPADAGDDELIGLLGSEDDIDPDPGLDPDRTAG